MTSPFSNRGNPALNSFATSLQRDNMSNSSILNAYVRLYRSTRFVQAAQHHCSHALCAVCCAFSCAAGPSPLILCIALCVQCSSTIYPCSLCATAAHLHDVHRPTHGIGPVLLVEESLRCSESLPWSTQCGRSCVCLRGKPTATSTTLCLWPAVAVACESELTDYVSARPLPLDTPHTSAHKY